MKSYFPPVVAGIGAGATLALAIAAQTPDNTIAETVAINLGASIPLSTVLGTQAPNYLSAERGLSPAYFWTGSQRWAVTASNTSRF